MKQLCFLMIVLALFQINCRSHISEAEATRKFAEWEANGIAKVKVDDLGQIYLNGKPNSLDELTAEFARIKKVNGAIWYYRLAQSQPSEAAGLAIMKKVVDFRLPVKMCASDDPCRKDFE